MKSCILALTLWAAAASAAPGPLVPGSLVRGSLVIVGGGLRADNAEVHKALLDRRPPGASDIAIIPSASGAPADSARAFAEALIRHGADPRDIVVVHLASEDDPDTKEVDERSWGGNAGNPVEIAKLARAGAIWFTGGDQLRTTRLLEPGGRDTPMLAAIRARLAAGAVLGGSSAGAAIMSATMITNGETMAALTRPVLRQTVVDNRREGGELVLGDGLGFLPTGLVDQHFDARARLGRLARALFELPAAERIGFGVDENTALVVDMGAGRARAIGAAGVTVLDARGAARSAGARFAADGIALSVLSGGDSLDLATMAVDPAPGKKPVGPRLDAPLAQGNAGGMAVPVPPLGEMLVGEIFARPGTPALERLSFSGAGAVSFRFTAGAEGRGYEGRDSAGNWRYAATGLRFRIRPRTLVVDDSMPAEETGQ
jgi:cyanophycinase